MRVVKGVLAVILAPLAALAFGAIDVNHATQAELESIKGIGPAISDKLLDERQKRSFKNWQDLLDRVKGIGENNAAKFSAAGLTVNGAAFGGAPAKAAASAARTAAKESPASAAGVSAGAAGKK